MFNNTLRKYNKENVPNGAFFTTRLHTYTKQDICDEVSKAIYWKLNVCLLKLTEEDLNYYKTNFNADVFKEYLANKYEAYQPPRKKLKQAENEKRPENLNLILTQESECVQFKSTVTNDKVLSTTATSTSACLSQPSIATIPAEYMLLSTTTNNSENSFLTDEESDYISDESTLQSDIIVAEFTIPSPTANIPENDSSTVKDSQYIPAESTLETDLILAEFTNPSLTTNVFENDSSTSEKSEYTPAVSTVEESDIKLVDYTLPSPTANVPIYVSSENEESEEITLSSMSESLIGQIRIKDPKTMMDGLMYKIFRSKFFNNMPITTTVNGVTNITPTCESALVKEKLSLNQIENLYFKYFTKEVQDTVFIIANILNITCLCNRHHKLRIDETFKKKSEALKLKERCDANRMHNKHKKVLESQFKNNFTKVLSLFEDSEFEHAFQMFFFSILTILKMLDEPKFKTGSIFMNLVLLLWNTLKSCDFDNPKVFTMFRSKQFRLDCIDLISVIEDGRKKDPGITDRMTLFFYSSINNQECFQKVIAAVTSNSSENLEILMNDALFQYRKKQNSKFKDPVKYKCGVSFNNAPEASVQNITGSDQSLNEIIQTIQLDNENNVQNIINNPTIENHSNLRTIILDQENNIQNTTSSPTVENHSNLWTIQLDKENNVQNTTSIPAVENHSNLWTIQLDKENNVQNTTNNPTIENHSNLRTIQLDKENSIQNTTSNPTVENHSNKRTIQLDKENNVQNTTNNPTIENHSNLRTIQLDKENSIQNTTNNPTIENHSNLRTIQLDKENSVQNTTSNPTIENHSNLRTIQLDKENNVQNTTSNPTVENHSNLWTIQLDKENNVQNTTDHTTVEHHSESESSQPLNTFSSSQSRIVSDESITSKVLSPKFCIVSSQSLFNGSFGQTFKPPVILPITTTPIKKPNSNTIIVGNKQYHIVRALSQVRTMNTQRSSTIVVKAKPLPKNIIETCSVKDCENLASIICSNCLSVTYCSNTCQAKHWFEGHKNDCDRIKYSSHDGQ